MTTEEIYAAELPLLAIANAGRKPSIYSRFLAFHKANPHVFEALKRMTREAHDAGHIVGIRCFWEVLRWDVIRNTVRIEGEFKLNDHYTTHYARLIMESDPNLHGFFELRRIRA
jgi:hypothetical protein